MRTNHRSIDDIYLSAGLIASFQIQGKISTVSAVVTRETFVRLLDISRLLGDVMEKRPKRNKAGTTTPALPVVAAPASPAPASPGWALAKSAKKAAKAPADLTASSQAASSQVRDTETSNPSL